MRFKNEAERLAHPVAGLIPGNLWFECYRFNSDFIEQFNIDKIDLSKDYSDFPAENKIKIWHLVLLLNQEPAESLIEFARSKLEIDTIYILPAAANLGKLSIINQFSKCEIEPLINDLFSRAAQCGHYEILQYLVDLEITPLLSLIIANNFRAFRLAAGNGQLSILKYFAKVASEKLPQMISTCNFYAYSQVAQNGHLDVLKYFAEVASEQLPQMISANNFSAFSQALQNGHLDVLKYFAEVAFHQISLMISVNNFSAFSQAAEHGHLDILKYLVALFPEQLVRMISFYSFSAFRLAAQNGHLDVLKYLAISAPEQLPQMISIFDFAAFRFAADNGRLNIIKYLAAELPDYLPQMIRTKNFDAFRNAAGNGHFEVTKCLAELGSDQLTQMISANNFEAFRNAAGNRHFEVMEHLVKIVPKQQLSQMLSADNVYAFRMLTCLNFQDRSMQSTKKMVNQSSEMLNDSNHYPYSEIFSSQRLNGINFLLGFAKIFGYAEMHFQEKEYSFLVSEHINNFLNGVQRDRSCFQETNPTAVFDFLTLEGLVNEERGLYGYYVLRQLIRQLSNNRYTDEVYTSIGNLLAIPSIKHLVLLNATQTNLPATHYYANDHFAEQTNELLRLAVNSNNRRVTHQLLAIPALFEAAQRHNFYEGASGLNLGELARDRESSMTGLTPIEQAQVKDLELVYQEKISAYREGITSVINELRNFLEQAFLSEEHLVLRQTSIREMIYTLPFAYEALTSLITTHAFTATEIQQINEVYYKNIYHTAWRYLSKPNLWMHAQASYVYIDEMERWSTFEEYQSFIAYLWLAASDNHYLPLEKDVTVNHRMDLFIRQLALINRAHNWDKSRVKLTVEGTQVLDSSKNPVTEEYDDLEGDKPSCFSGVKRRLFQALLDHPLYTPIDNAVISQFIKQEIRAYYTHYLQNIKLDELTVIQQELGNYWSEFVETDRLKSLSIHDDEFIKEALIRQFTPRVSTCFGLIPTILHPTGLENSFLANYQTLSLESLLSQLINQKQDSILLSQANDLLPTAALTSDEKLLKEILAEVQEALCRYNAYHTSPTSAGTDELRNRQGFFTNESKLFAKATAFCETLQAESERTGSLRDVLHQLKDFFEMSAKDFYPHSFTCYLADALAKLQIIRPSTECYTQLGVVSEFETWLANYLARQEEVEPIIEQVKLDD